MFKGQVYLDSIVGDGWYAKGVGESSRAYLIKGNSSEFETYGIKLKYAIQNDTSIIIGWEKRVESFFDEVAYQVGGNLSF